jgi:hypothetical protein
MSLRNTGIQNIGAFLRGELSLSPSPATEVAGSGSEFLYEGTVVDEVYRPIRGARVTLIGTPLAITTDELGRFRLSDAARTGATD